MCKCADEYGKIDTDKALPILGVTVQEAMAYNPDQQAPGVTNGATVDAASSTQTPVPASDGASKLPSSGTYEGSGKKGPHSLEGG